MTLGEKLREARAKKKVTQAQAAEGIGVSLRTYKSYELGQSFPQNRGYYEKLADYYQLDINYLLTDDKDFILTAGDSFGYRGRREAAELVQNVIALFAGGQLSEEDQNLAMQAIQQAYFDAKTENKKFTPKKYRPIAESKAAVAAQEPEKETDVVRAAEEEDETNNGKRSKDSKSKGKSKKKKKN